MPARGRAERQRRGAPPRVAAYSHPKLRRSVTNFFRSYRGKNQEFAAVVQLTGGAEPQTVSLMPSDFRAIAGESMASWGQVDLISLRAYYEKDGTLLGSKSWAGERPKFRELRWDPGQR